MSNDDPSRRRGAFPSLGSPRWLQGSPPARSSDGMLEGLIHSERELDRDQWVHLTSADVGLPDGRQLDRRMIRAAAPGAGCVIVVDRRVLLMWRHRFITDIWAWKIPT